MGGKEEMRLVDADELLKHASDHESISTHLIWNAPTVDPVRHGRWEIPEGHGEARVCSECGMICHADRAMVYNYCPNCGADVRPEWRKKER